MEIRIPDGLDINIHRLLRRAGYIPLGGKRAGIVSWVCRCGANQYPRFHLYVRSKKTGLGLALHFDQKRPVYPGAHAHNAEYEGKILEEEKGRIESIIKLRV